MKLLNSLCGLFLVIFVTGCATQKTLQQAGATADFGPAPANPTQLVRSYFSQNLYQPGSLQIKSVSQPYQGYAYDPAYIPKGENFSWGIKTTVTAKDHGGYDLGWKNYVLFVRNNKVLNAYEVIPPQTAEDWVRPVQ